MSDVRSIRCDRCQRIEEKPSGWVRVTIEVFVEMYSRDPAEGRCVDLCPSCGGVFAKALRETLDELKGGA